MKPSLEILVKHLLLIMVPLFLTHVVTELTVNDEDLNKVLIILILILMILIQKVNYLSMIMILNVSDSDRTSRTNSSSNYLYSYGESTPIDTYTPDIIIGCETWLTPAVLDNEVIPY